MLFKDIRRYQDKFTFCVYFFKKSRLSSPVHKLSIAAIKSFDCHFGTALVVHPFTGLSTDPSPLNAFELEVA